MNYFSSTYPVHQHSASNLPDAVVNQPGRINKIILVHILRRRASKSIDGHLDSLGKFRHDLFPQHFHGLEDPLGVNARLVIIHLGLYNVADPGGSTPDRSGSSIQSIGVALLQGEHALVYVLENVVLGDGEEVVDRRDVVDSLGEYAHLVFPGLPEHLHVVESDLGARSGGQNARRVDNLWAEVLDLGRCVADHLHAVLVARHTAYQVGDLVEENV